MDVKLFLVICAYIWGVSYCVYFTPSVCRHYCRHLKEAKCMKTPNKELIGRSCVCKMKVGSAPPKTTRTLSYRAVIQTIGEDNRIHTNTYDNACRLEGNTCVTTGCSLTDRTEISPKSCSKKPHCPTFTFEILNKEDVFQVGRLQGTAISYGRSLCDPQAHSMVTQESLSSKDSYYWEIVVTNPDLWTKKNGTTFLSVAFVDTNSAEKWKNVAASDLSWSIAFTQTMEGTQLKVKNESKTATTMWRSPKTSVAFLLDRHASRLHVLDRVERQIIASLSPVPGDKPMYLLITLGSCVVYINVVSGVFLGMTDAEMVQVLASVKQSK